MDKNEFLKLKITLKIAEQIVKNFIFNLVIYAVQSIIRITYRNNYVSSFVFYVVSSTRYDMRDRMVGMCSNILAILTMMSIIFCVFLIKRSLYFRKVLYELSYFCHTYCFVCV